MSAGWVCWVHLWLVSDVRGVELEFTRMSGATRMGVPKFALDLRKGVGVLLFGPEGQTVFVICWSVALVCALMKM